MLSGRQFLQSRVNSLFSSVTYRLGSTVIDPGDTQNWNGVREVLLTHVHFDHIYGLNDLWETNSTIKVYTNQAGYRALLDARLNLSKYHGEPFTFGHPDSIVMVDDNQAIILGDGLTARAVFTPGHNDSCITWLIGDMMFTGDAYIPGIKVVTNLPGANRDKASKSAELILELAAHKTIFPGHQVQ